MRIAVNTRMLLENRMEGVARFNYEILKRIVKNNPQDEFYFLFDRKYSDKFIFGSNVKPIVLFPPTRHATIMPYWLEIKVKNTLKRINPDVFFSGDTYLSLGSPTPSIIVSHDLGFFHFPEHLRYFDRKYYNHYFKKFHKKADKIIAVSEYTKTDIVKNYGINPEKIEVVYNAANHHFHPIKEEEKEKIKEEISDKNPYFVYLGSIHPRKNLINLIKGFNLFKSKTNNNYNLMIIGRPAFKTEEFYQTIEESPYKDHIKVMQKSRAALPQYIGSAEAMFYVSTFEGFGIPILEGFEAGIPVVTSNTTSMPEVAKDAALLVDPYSPEDIANAMKQIYSDKDLCKSLIEKGNERLQYFSWDKSAEKTYKIIKEVARKT